jgi:ubiquinone/menaquinone biosynthesis C-methylase UbiE
MNDRDIERHRYDKRADLLLNSNKFNYINKIPKYLNAPYEYYFKLLKGKLQNQSKVLEIGAGMGENTGFLIDMAYKVHSIDISPKSVEIMNNKFSEKRNFSAEVADMEKLPFDDESFDVVCSAGSLSYGDNFVVMGEIYRVLKQGGVAIVVDSLNNNPIYRFNRYIHYLKGNRSKSTLIRMPTVSLINKYTKKFGYVEVRFFGAITWTFPLLSRILIKESMIVFSNWIDGALNIKRSAFKFAMMVVKK